MIGASARPCILSLTDVLIDEIALGDNGADLRQADEQARMQPDRHAASQFGRLCLSGGSKSCAPGPRSKRTVALTKRWPRDAGATFDGTSDGAKSEGNTRPTAALLNARVFRPADAVLTYGVVMTPTCLAPKTARFARTLPTTAFGGTINYVLYHIVEPLLPALEMRSMSRQIAAPK